MPSRIRELLFVANRLAPKLPLDKAAEAPVNAWDRAVDGILKAENSRSYLFRGDRLDALGDSKTINDSGEARPTSPLAPAKKSDGARLFGHRVNVCSQSCPGALAIDELLSRPPDGPLGKKFIAALYGAYRGGTPLSIEEMDALRLPLGDGYAYRVLLARMAERRGEDFASLIRDAETWAQTRVYAMAIFAGLVFFLILAGIVGIVVQLFRPLAHPPRLPGYSMSGKAALIVVLGWLLALRLSGTFALCVIQAFGLPNILMLPVATAFHALSGLFLLTVAEGVSCGDLWRMMISKAGRGQWLWSVAFLGMAICSVIVVAHLFAPLTRGLETPQVEVRELVSGVRGLWAVLCIALAIGLIAPVFEEFFFRGFILPFLGGRFLHSMGHKNAWLAAIGVSGCLFGVIHFQPAAIPSLAALGVILGCAYVRTGTLWTSIVVHACWNTGAFVAMKVLG